LEGGVDDGVHPARKAAAANGVEFVDVQFASIVVQIGHVSPSFFRRGHPLMHGRRGDMESRSVWFIGRVISITLQIRPL
jgi:hypothetical protein